MVPQRIALFAGVAANDRRAPARLRSLDVAGILKGDRGAPDFGAVVDGGALAATIEFFEEVLRPLP